MPGNFRNIPPKPVPARPSQTGSRPAAPRPSAAPQPNLIRRSTNLQRVEERQVRREAAQAIASQIQPRPRPAVRPIAPPQKIMPSIPAPVHLQGARPAIPPRQHTAPQGSRGMPAFNLPPAPAMVAAAGGLALNAALAPQEISADVASLNRALEDVQNRSSLGNVLGDVTNLDSTLNHVIPLVESARSKGYRFQKSIDEEAYALMSQWQTARAQVLNTMQQQAQMLQARLPSLAPQVQRANMALNHPAAAAPHIRSLQAEVNNLSSAIEQVERSLENSYAPIETQAQKLNTRLTQIHWALDQLAAARFQLEKNEDLAMAVQARWDKEGKDDPEGILYLTNRRLIFERKEKVATKKILFITTASELVQEVLIAQPFSGVGGAKPENKGLFGHQDFLIVQFNDPKLGNVPFHINGQDSKDWSDLLEKARSGRIEEERLGGAGLSIADLSGPLAAADVLAVQTEINELQDEVMLQAVRQQLSDVENNVLSLGRTLAGLRSRGYTIEKDLEGDITLLETQWERIKNNAGATIEHQARSLGEAMESIQGMMAHIAGLMGANPNSANEVRPSYMQIKSSIASVEAQADAAEDTALAQFDEYGDEVESLAAHLDWIGWMLDALATASFRLLATESGIAAAEAMWAAPGQEAENGILYLTDKRLLWEDRVGDYELKVDLPLEKIAGASREVEGEREILAFQFGPGAPFPATRFTLALPVAEEWAKMIGRARSGGYALDRAVELDPAEVERVRNAPQQCANCGAVFTSPILRGQTDLTCVYCGKVTRL